MYSTRYQPLLSYFGGSSRKKMTMKCIWCNDNAGDTIKLEETYMWHGLAHIHFEEFTVPGTLHSTAKWKS
jgi:hypothetical protein